jgi:hypothetical protein
MKWKKIIILIVGFVFSFLVASIFLRVWGHDPVIISRAPYDVNVPGSPRISAKLYSLRRDEYLLILTTADTGRREKYWFNVRDGRIGVPDFPTYLPVGKWAVISKNTLDGFQYLDQYVADWQTGDGVITLTFKGRPEAIREAAGVSMEDMRSEISYERQVILRAK